MVSRPQPLKLTAEFIVDAAEMIVEVALQEFGDVALELTLLAARLIPEAMIQDPSGLQLVIRILDSKSKRGVFSGIGSRRVSLELPEVTIGYLQALLLRAYRDGMAEVDHIHMETTSVDLTLLFAVSVPPLSANEATRLLQG